MNRPPHDAQRIISTLIIAMLFITSLSLTTMAAPPTTKHHKRKVATRPCVKDIAHCPLQGCGGDPLLNELKNAKNKPASVDKMTLAQIVALNTDSPTSWKMGRARDEFQTLGEGKGIEVKGWLIGAHLAGTPEACNCKLKGPDNNDFHLNLTARKTDAMNNSIVVEMSPQSRDSRWTLAKIVALADQITYVRVTGFLMFDSQHAAFKSMPRATAWEVHPVTKFEVCTTTQAKCDQGTGWKALESLQ